jgi:hypothetical protein
MISAQMVGKFARAPLLIIGAATGEFAHPTAQIIFHIVKQPTLR